MTKLLQIPGVYREERILAAPVGPSTGVPVFLGRATTNPDLVKQRTTNTDVVELRMWGEFAKLVTPDPHSYLAHAVRGFFENDGQVCYVYPLSEMTISALEKALAELDTLRAADLICAPDIGKASPTDAISLQACILAHCDRMGDRFAILDTRQGVDAGTVLREQRRHLHGINGALYYPWIKGIHPITGEQVRMPPCGHVAGVYARSDQRVGVHKAPANEILEGALDVDTNLTVADQEELSQVGVNCIRAFRGRGIRIWGARTLAADQTDPLCYVNVRRLFLTVSRWIERNMAFAAFEPNDMRLWEIIKHDLTIYFDGLFQRGALKGDTAADAFYVKCDRETNPPEVCEQGQVVTEIGLAPTIPGEFIVVHLIHSAGGTTIGEPGRPEQ